MQRERAGNFKKQLSGELSYFSFMPTKLPPNPPIEISDDIIGILIKAHNVLAILDDRAKNISNMNLFVSMYVQKEALLSSQIEGTQATLEDIFNPEIFSNINADVEEVVNYVKATNYAIERLNTLPICNKLLLETHEILLSGVRGKEKNPGEFRQSQNWIGGLGSTLKNAKYIPPAVDDMKVALSDLEKYINEENGLDHLIRIALIHYQFESIHPFLDGNGRIGRLLIILYLLENKIIKTPALYISYYLKQNRIEYYDRMTAVRDTGNYEQWIKFFLEAIYKSGKSAIETADKLITLKEKNIKLIENEKFTKSTQETVIKVFQYLESHPIIDISKTAKDLSMSYNTISKAVQRLERIGILKLANNQERNRVFIYQEYVDILSLGTELEES